MRTKAFKGFACVMALVSALVLWGCGKKEESATEKVVNYVAAEAKAKITGRLDEIAGRNLKYDHEGLAKAVKNPKSVESVKTAEKVLGQMQQLNSEWTELKANKKEIREIIDGTVELAKDIDYLTKLKSDINNGKDVSKTSLHINHRKMLALTLSDELAKAVGVVCNDIIDAKSQEVINADWEYLIQCRERCTNFIDNKPVIYKKRNMIKASDNDPVSANLSADKAALNVLNYYCEAISNKLYQRAFNVFSPDLQKRFGGYNNYVSGMNAIDSIKITDYRVIMANDVAANVEVISESKVKVNGGIAIQKYKENFIIEKQYSVWKIAKVISSTKIDEKIIQKQ